MPAEMAPQNTATISQPVAGALQDQITVNSTGFRFLDLSAQLRNKIYVYASEAAFKTPIRMNKFVPQVMKPEPPGVKRPRARRRRTKRPPAHRLAMLFTNCQIYLEASQIYHGTISIDLWNCHARNVLRETVVFGTVFKTKLQFVRHTEMEYLVSELFMFAGPQDKEFVEHWIQDWGDLLQSLEKAPKHLFGVRTLFYNLESIKIYPNGPRVYNKEWWDSHEFNWSVIVNLANPECRQFLHRVFQKLKDVVTVNRYDSERYHKRGTGQWEFHYSHEGIPLLDREDLSQFGAGVLFDQDTRLSIATTLNCIGANPVS